MSMPKPISPGVKTAATKKVSIIGQNRNGSPVITIVLFFTFSSKVPQAVGLKKILLFIHKM